MGLIARVLAALAIAVVFGIGAAQAQTDEIQVYDASIVAPGGFSVTDHNNYTPSGRKLPDYPGAIMPDHALNGVVETAYGAAEWLELGLYLPLYSLTNDGRALFNGAKLRALFVLPDARARTFFYGVNFEFSMNARHWEATRNSGEIRPIIGWHWGAVDLILNPIIDTSFNGLHALDFAPAERVAYNLSPTWAAAVEHYADFGQISRFDAVERQNQTLFAVADYNIDSTSLEFGIGHGFTAASDRMVLKLIVTQEF
jgi:hypothetical protein